jgi:hypothetical protein
MGGEVDPSLLDDIFEITAGNPFFTGEIARAMREQGRVEREEGRWVGSSRKGAPLPEGLRDWVRVRLERIEFAPAAARGARPRTCPARTTVRRAGVC